MINTDKFLFEPTPAPPLAFHLQTTQPSITTRTSAAFASTSLPTPTRILTTPEPTLDEILDAAVDEYNRYTLQTVHASPPPYSSNYRRPSMHRHLIQAITVRQPGRHPLILNASRHVL